MYRAYFVDDEPFILEGLAHIIPWADFGIEISGSTTNPLKALDELMKGNTDILISDVRMPEMDGIQLIEELRRGGIPIKCIIISAYSDFEYVKRGMSLGVENYLLKPIDENELALTMLSAVEKIESERKDRPPYVFHDVGTIKVNLLVRWTRNQISMKELREKAIYAGLDLSGTSCVCSMIRILDAGCGIGAVSSEAHSGLLRSRAMSACAGVFARKATGVAFNRPDGTIVIIQHDGLPNFDPEGIRSLLEACIDEIRKVTGCETYAAIGTFELGMEDLYRSYRQAETLLDGACLTEANRVLRADDRLRDTAELERILDLSFASLRTSILENDRKNSRAFVDSLFSVLQAHFQIGDHELRDALVIAVSVLVGTQRTIAGGTDSAAISNPFENFRAFFDLRTFDDMRRWFMNRVEDLQRVAVANARKHSPVIQEVIRHIGHHYMDEDLSLKRLSLIFNINTAYLGQLFRNETGEFLVDYLNAIRVRKAESMLLASNCSSKQICTNVGFSSPSYFNYIFKKINGSSPSEFRRRALFKAASESADDRQPFE